jgi:DNA-binding transcriptional LysR family regulator
VGFRGTGLQTRGAAQRRVQPASRHCAGPGLRFLRLCLHACHTAVHGVVSGGHATLPRMPKLTPVDINRPSPAQATAEALGAQVEDWNLLRSFMAIYETGTLTEAARRLGTTQPSMGRHLRELEGLLGETLFVRLPGQLKANLRAQALFAAVAPMLQASREAARLFSDHPERTVGVVRVAVSEAYGYHVVPQLLAPLLGQEPGLEIELAVANTSDNLLRREADIAVRHFRPQQDDIITRKLGATELGLYVHERYIERFGLPTSLTLHEGAFWVGFDRMPMPVAAALRGAAAQGSDLQTPRFRWRSDALLTLQAVVETGAAVGMFYTDIAAQRPGLHRVLADQVGIDEELWLCAHDELRRSRRMRRVWDHLGDALEARLLAFAATRD